MTDDDRRTAYNQAWENTRHQDKLGWSRVKAIGLVEGAMLLAMVQQGSLGQLKLSQVFVTGVILVLLVSLLALKDGIDAAFHLDQAATLGEALGVPKGGPRFPKYLKGRYVFPSALCVLNVFNLYLLIQMCY